MPRWNRLLVTGAAGEIGSVIRPALRGAATHCRWHDIRPVTDAAVEESDAGRPRGARRGTRRHARRGLPDPPAGIPRETGGTVEDILRANVIACHAVFEAARQNGVKRFVFASSNHTIGFHPADALVGTEERPRPSGQYGASKVWGEALGRLYADKHGMEVACLRIGAFRAKPGNARELGGWISHGDMAGLARAAVDAAPFHFLVVYGVSANRRALWGKDEAARAALGWWPKDDSEAYAAELEDKRPPAGSVAARFHGGVVCEYGFSGDPDRIR